MSRMQKLNCTWRQQKTSSSGQQTKVLTNNDNSKPSTNRRRLGRFAIAVSSVTSGKTSSELDKQESFLSSFAVNNDLLEEMDKIEANTTSGAGSCKDGCKNTAATNTKSAAPSNAKSGTRVEASNAVHNRGSVVKRHLNKNPSSIDKPCLESLKRTDSPTSSPIDKKQRLQRRTGPAKLIIPEGHGNKTSLVSDSNADFVRRKNGIDLSSSNTACTDISFSPLITTPDVSPNSSDSETSSPSKPESTRKIRGKCQSKRTPKHPSEKPNSKINDTPKRPKAKKRPSPKFTKSPVCKAVRAQNHSNVPMVQSRELPIAKSIIKKSENNVHGVSLSKSCDYMSSKNEMAMDELNKGGNTSVSPSHNHKVKESLLGSEGQDHTGKGKKSDESKCKRKNKISPRILNENSDSTLHAQNPCPDEPAESIYSSSNKTYEEREVGKSHCQSTQNTDTSGVEKMAVIVGDTSLTEDKRMLSSWGLPQPVLEAYKNQGVSTMFEWQAECLLAPGVLDGGNLVYSAPTSAGKTLVAELLVLKRVVETRKKALIILPFVSVAREKMFSLKRLYQDAGIKVGGYMGSYSPSGGLAALDVAVCTIEKGNGLVNRMMEDGRIEDIGIVVVDELHMIGDSHRGYLLELMLTKLSYMSCRQESQQSIQIVGMSATLPNLEVLSKWLQAALYRTEFRPVPLSEHIKIDTKILDGQLHEQGQIPAYLVSPDDSDHVVALCLETVLGGHSVLIFCPTKNWCEKLCETIARKFYDLSHSSNIASKEDKDSSSALLTLNKAALRESIEQLRRCPVGVDPLIRKCLLNGVAYHHAGLTFDERDIIEGAFRQGQLKVLVATSTLSSGVNLPARRVIIRTPMFHGRLLDTLTYKQMSGRAGRKGVDTEGESVLICKASENMKGKRLLQSDLPAVESCLSFGEDSGLSRSLKRAILEVVVSGVASCPSEVTAYINCTLLSASLELTEGKDQIRFLVERCTKFLQDNEFVSLQTVVNEDGSEMVKFYPTQFGSAILASSMSPDEGITVFAELQKARRSFVLETDLHIIYLVTPIYTNDISSSLDWYHYYTLWEGLTPADRRVADLVGVSEAFIARAISGRISAKTEAQRKSLAIHQRFYTALVLNTLVQEVPLMEVAARFNLNKGQLQSLQQSASTYAGMVTVFSGRLGWHSLELILSNFQRRLSLGVQHELVDLVRISALNASSARMLYNAGFITVADVAHAEPREVENLFKKAVPFQSEKKQEGETEWERQERCKARCVWLTGRKGMTELDAAVAIVEEAKQIIQGDLGIKAVVWSSKEDDQNAGNDDSEDSAESNEEDGRVNKSIVNEKNICDTQTSKVSKRRNSIKITPDVEEKNTSTYCRRSHRFTQLKMRRSTDDTPIRPSSCARKKCSSSGHKYKTHGRSSFQAKTSLTHADVSSNKNTILSAVTPPNEISISRRVGQESDSVKRRRSDKSLSKERSFFGQVVVSPPAGVSPRDRQGHVDSSDNLIATGYQRKTLNEQMRISEELNGPREKTCSGSGSGLIGQTSELVRKEKSDPKSHQKQEEIRDMNERILPLASIENILHSQRTTHQNSNVSRTVEIVKNDNLDTSPNIFCDDDEWLKEVCEEKNLLISNGKVLRDGFKGSMHEDAHNEENAIKTGDTESVENTNETDDAESVECSFSCSFVLDTQTVNIINQGIQSDTPGKLSDPGQSHQTSSEKSTDATQSLTISIISENVGGSEIRPEKTLADRWEKYDQELNCVDFSHETFSDKRVGKSSSHHDEQLLADRHQDVSTNSYSSLVAASDYEDAGNFDEGMLECSSTDDEDQCVENSPGGQQSIGLNASDGICGGTFDKIDAFSTPESRSQPSEIQLADDSLLAAVGMSSCCPSTPKTIVNNDRVNAVKKSQKAVKKSQNAVKKSQNNVNKSQQPSQSSLSANIANHVHNRCSGHDKPVGNFGDVNIPSKSPQMREVRSQRLNADNQVKPDLEDDFFSDSLTASLVDQAFAQCKRSLDHSVTRMKSRNGELSSDGICNAKAKLMPESHNQRVCQKHVGINQSSSPGADLEEDLTSNNSSRNDGNDCIPPTPPDENLSYRCSPSLKRSFFTPVKLGDESSACESSKNIQKKRNPTCRTSNLFGESLKNPDRVGRCIEKASSSSKGHALQEGNAAKKHLVNGQAHGNGLPSVSEHREIRAPEIDVGDEGLSDRDGASHDPTSNDPCPVTASQLLTQQSFSIIDVCADKQLFHTFVEEWKCHSNFALALACEKLPLVSKDKTAVSIGGKFITKQSLAKCEDNPRGLVVPDSSVMIVGMSVSWENRDAYFISFVESQLEQVEQDADDSLAEPPLSEALPLSERVHAVCEVLKPCTNNGQQTINVYDAKTAYIYIAKTLGVSLSGCQDPRVADWLKEQGNRLKNLHRMVVTFLPEEIPLLEAVGGVSGFQGLGTDVRSKISGRVRACTESVLTSKLMVEYRGHLEREQLWDAFLNTEMPSLVSLARMEMNGFGINLGELEAQKVLMTTKLEKLEEEAYRLAGHPFSLTSTDDIARILYLELKLPINGDPDIVRKLPTRNTRRKCSSLGGTGKEVLEKLEKFHTLPTLVLEWRRISSALTKSLFALQKAAKQCPRLQMMRVFGDCQIFSSTGRVSLAEPNIQNIPKDFAIQLPELGGKAGAVLTTPVSMRRLFVPFQGGLMLGADYSQLELRIIAHLSEDKRLIQILNSDTGDVFKLIAAQLKVVEVGEVTPSDRQQAKQVCYGMLYGIGPKALGDQLGMCQEEASVFMETFKSKYPGVRRYLRETVEFCQKNGYVTTLFNRRRYLPAIKHNNPHARAHAERQAVNTSIQGSAADLVKKAMIAIDRRLMEIFPDSQLAHLQAGRLNGSSNSNQANRQNPKSPHSLPTGAFFVLQLHDELIYEVSSGHVDTVAQLVKQEMEKAVELLVKMPVKVKVGPSWGHLEDYDTVN